VKEHVAVFPDASVATQTVVVVPTGKNDPDAGVHATVCPGQLSAPAGVAKLITAPHWFASFACVTFAGHTIEGGWVSFTVTVKLQVPSGLFADASATVQLTVVVPTGNVDPDAGTQTGTPTPGQLSAADGAV